MASRFVVSRLWVGVVFAGALLVLAACAPAAQPAAPAAAPAQPAPAAKPAAEPAKPAAEAPKPAAQPAKPAAQPAKPAAQPAKPAAAPAKPGQIIELRTGCSHVKGGILCNAVDKFAEVVAQKTNGQVVVRDFYQALGVEHQLTQSVMTGSVDLGGISDGNSGRFSVSWYTYGLPFLFKKFENVFTSIDSPAGKSAVAQFEKDLGVKWLMPVSLGSGRHIQTTKKQLKVPADIKGMKIRVVSTPADLATFKAWGANPTPVDWAQTYTALQQGVVEGMQPDIGAVLTNKMYEVVKYNLVIDYQALFWNFFMNAKKFESLSPEHQKAILEAAQEARAHNMKENREYLKFVMDELVKHGMVHYIPTPDEYNQWASIREKVWQEVAAQEKGKIDLAMARQIYESQ
ncbi:MAG: TRAP transporter substrate-binding protein [Chloroflexi bacterium]|nr:TRAP transporter substrate-binding protein [Chloroflexota bacterium]